MSNKQESALERMERLKREREMAKEKAGQDKIVGQLTHEDDGEPDFGEIANKLEELKNQEPKSENEGYVKMTIYVEEKLARSFNALITKRGQQKEFVNIALKDFVQKKIKELGL